MSTMHELPSDLASSLRSYRGSIYRGGRQSGGDGPEDVDLEKGLPGDEQGEIGHPIDSSHVLRRSRSYPSLDQARQEQADNYPEPTQYEQAGDGYGASRLDPADRDIERGQQENVGDDGELNPPEPTGNDGPPMRPPQLLRFESNRNSQHRPRLNTNIKQSKHRHDAQTPAPLSVIQAPPVKDLDPAAERLAMNVDALKPEHFYALMGMRPPPPYTPGDYDGETPKALAIPNGLFDKITSSLRWMNWKYHVFAVAVYVLLILQLAISAVFIILGALSHIDTHITIAILGAVSTVIAGGLALMQGQGLPNRLRMSRDALASVVFEAEELYWDMRTGRDILYKDIKKVREDYLRVLEEQKRNHPDAWNSVTNKMEHGAGKAGEGEGGVAGEVAGEEKIR